MELRGSQMRVEYPGAFLNSPVYQLAVALLSIFVDSFEYITVFDKYAVIRWHINHLVA